MRRVLRDQRERAARGVGEVERVREEISEGRVMDLRDVEDGLERRREDRSDRVSSRRRPRVEGRKMTDVFKETFPPSTFKLLNTPPLAATNTVSPSNAPRSISLELFHSSTLFPLAISTTTTPVFVT